MKETKKNVEICLYLYEVSGYFFADNERKHFYVELYAQDNFEAMERVLGQLAWKASIEHKAFKLDVIHYECL